MEQTPIQTRQMSLDEFLALPESQNHVEFIKGEVWMSPTPIYSHQKIVFNVAKVIDKIGNSGETVISPMDVYFADDVILQPDVFWVAPDNEGCFVADDYWHGAPDLVVEVLSPSTATRDRGVKYDVYEASGVREYWLIDPSALNIEIYVLQASKFQRFGVFGNNDSVNSPVLSDTTIPVNTIFR